MHAQPRQITIGCVNVPMVMPAMKGFSSFQLLGPIGAYLGRYPCFGRTPTLSTSTELESTIHLKAADSTKWVIAFEMSAMDRLDMGSSI